VIELSTVRIAFAFHALILTKYGFTFDTLSNLGIRALPREVEYVAWLDCDVIFLNSGWAAEAKRQLERGATVVQLFEQARHLAPGWEPGRSGGEALGRAETLFYEESCASALAAGTYFGVDRHGGRGRVEAEQGRFDFSRPPVASGMAWAAKRRWIETVQLYDACVIGGGDRAFALAASGRSDLLCRRRPMTQDHALHYAEWAQQLNNQEETSLGVVSGELLHLWHGQYARRNYRERHQLLTELHFNPYDDLATAENGSLRWAEHANKLGNAVAEYFVSRREDGEYRPVACSAWTKQGPC